MNNNHVMPGVAAISLALLFPLYWTIVLVMGVESHDFADALRDDMLTLSWMDGLFLLIGILEIYIYFSLIRVFNDRLPSQAAKVFLFVIIGSVFMFHVVVFADVFLAATQGSIMSNTIDVIVTTSVYLSIAALVVFTISGIGLSVVLLAKSEFEAPLLKAFAIILLLVCILQATMLFAMVNLILFPIALVTLAVYFFKDPDTLEVV